MIVACGEALVDLIPEEDDDGGMVYRPVLGGSLFTVALGVARLGGKAAYLWELSNDTLGQKFLRALRAEGVDAASVSVSDRPTPVAVIDLSGPEPRYNIADPGGVMVDTPLSDLPSGTACLQIGSAVLAREPVGSAIEVLARAAPFVTLDINARPPSIVDPPAYRARLRRIAALGALVKASDADVEMIGEGDPETYMHALVEEGAALAVLTEAEAGARAFRPGMSAYAASCVEDVVNAVGAGDAFMAALLCDLQRRNALGRAGVAALSKRELEAAMAFAQRAAAFTCACRGAEMPTLSQLAAAAAPPQQTAAYGVVER